MELTTVSVFCGIAVTLLFIAKCIRNVYFHSLSKFPGPVAAAMTPIWISHVWNSGNYVFAIKKLHDKYGPVVRIAPNQLSFCNAASWRDIYGHIPGRKPFLKSKFFYEAMPGESENILTVADPRVHSRMRRNLSHGFSAAALTAQEGIVEGFIDKLIHKLSQGPNNPKDMVTLLNMLTFDIIGQLAFGESFGNLEAGKPHFWLEILFDSIEALAFLRSFEYFTTLRSLVRWVIGKKLLPTSMTAELEKVNRYSIDQIEKRLNASPQQVDLLAKMLQNSKEEGVSFDKLQAQADVLILAGSETTATALSGMLYYLGRNPEIYHNLANEIRRTFNSYDEITNRATEPLQYLKAVIDEGLRIYPPVPIGLPRVSPGETVDDYYIPKDTIVHVSSWAATHSEANFHRPFDFIPERWLDTECKDKKNASRPFILGNRACLGRNLAQLEMRVFLSKLTWVYDFSLKDDTDDWILKHKTFVFWKKPPLWMNFTPRNVQA